MLAAYRVGDSPANVITPLMAYFPLIVIFTQTLFFVASYLIGLPLGPRAPVKTN